MTSHFYQGVIYFGFGQRSATDWIVTGDMTTTTEAMCQLLYTLFGNFTYFSRQVNQHNADSIFRNDWTRTIRFHRRGMIDEITVVQESSAHFNCSCVIVFSSLTVSWVCFIESCHAVTCVSSDHETFHIWSLHYLPWLILLVDPVICHDIHSLIAVWVSEVCYLVKTCFTLWT